MTEVSVSEDSGFFGSVNELLTGTASVINTGLTGFASVLGSLDAVAQNAKALNTPDTATQGETEQSVLQQKADNNTVLIASVSAVAVLGVFLLIKD